MAKFVRKKYLINKKLQIKTTFMYSQTSFKVNLQMHTFINLIRITSNYFKENSDKSNYH